MELGSAGAGGGGHPRHPGGGRAANGVSQQRPHGRVPPLGDRSAAAAVVAVADRDIVYTNAYFGASLPAIHEQNAHLLAAIISSSLASWFFLMSGAELGIKKMRLLRHDVSLLPVPDLSKIAKSEPGRRLLQLERKLQRREALEADWSMLDEAVMDLYGLHGADRIVVRDGMFRASWQWEKGRESSGAPAETSTLTNYANVFLSVMCGWLATRNKRRMRAEVLDLAGWDSLRVVRFILEDGPGQATVDVQKPAGELSQILEQIGKRLNVKLGTSLSGARELRVHGRHEVVIIKPSAGRYWMGISALEDADAVVAESFTGGTA